MLFDNMRKKMADYPELRKIIYAILFRGESYPYNPDNFAIDIGAMFGFITERDGQAVVANRIFETRLYNLFLSEEVTKSITYQTGELEKNQFIKKIAERLRDSSDRSAHSLRLPCHRAESESIRLLLIIGERVEYSD